MTVSSQIDSVAYNGNGVTVSFPVTFRFLENTHLRVIRTIIATGVSTDLILDSLGADGFSVVGAGQPAGGTVTVVTAPVGPTPNPDLAERLTIERNVPSTQETDYLANDPFPAESHERALDKLTMIVQQVIRGLSRSPQLGAGQIDGQGRYDGKGNQLGNLADATESGDAVTLGQVGNLISIPTGPFVQLGTGAVPRTVQERLRDTVSAADYGVTPGITDQSLNLQTALNASASLGKPLLLPAGEYLANDLTYSGPGIYGDGGAILKQSAGSGGTLLTVTSSAQIRGLTFDGNKANKTGNPMGLVLNGADGALVDGCTFLNHRYKVLILEDAPGARVNANWFHDSGDIANCNQIEVKTPYVAVTGNTFETIGDGHCIRLGYFLTDTPRDVQGVVISGNTFHNSQHVGVTCELGARDSVIDGNTFIALESGVKVEASPDATNITVSNNIFRDLTNNVGTCLNMSGDRTVFQGNHVINCPSGPFFGPHGICSGNKFINSGTTGQYMVSSTNVSAVGSIVSGNEFDGITGGAINIGNGSQITDNRILSATQFGVRVYGDLNIVRGNRIIGTDTGLSLVSSLTNSVVAGNLVGTSTTANMNNAAAAGNNFVRDNLGCPDNLRLPVIASGVITIGQFDNLIRVDTEGGAATDDLDTINGGVLGQRITVYSVSATRDPTLKDGTGNLRLAGDFVLATTNEVITLISDGTVWREVGRSTNG